MRAILFLLLATFCYSQDNSTLKAQQGDILWKASLCVLTVATTADAASSLGKMELNPILRSSDGRFGARGVSIKLALLGSNITLQSTRKKHRRLHTILNFAVSGVYFTIAAMNVRVKRAQ